jgi:hypothetical protein
VLATRHIAWPAEIEYPVAAVLALVGSLALGALVIHVPGVARIV